MIKTLFETPITTPPPEPVITTVSDFESESAYRDSTYDVVSKVAYLIGVPKRIFEKEHEPPQLDIYAQLEKVRNARIVRNLCIIRNAIEHCFGRINEKMRYDYVGLHTLPEYIPQEAIKQLSADGVNFYKNANRKLWQHIAEINKLLTDRINNCKDLFPVWLNWAYIRELFIMPDGQSEAGTKAAADVFFKNLECYPYQVYINWDPEPKGNILYCDKKFVTCLYRWHDDNFNDYSKVSDANGFVKSNIYKFIKESDRTIMVVDCENSDPYRLCAALKGLGAEIAAKIQKIMLIDDVNTIDAWRILEGYTSIPVEHIMTERVKRSKSLVDIELTALTCREHYKNDVDRFIIASSDSDYWGLISSLPTAKFMVMVEREKCGPDMKAALVNSNIFYCYIEDFYTGDGEDLKKMALFNILQKNLSAALAFNVRDMLDAALLSARIEMSSASKQQFFDKYIKPMRVAVNKEGNMIVELNIKKK